MGGEGVLPIPAAERGGGTGSMTDRHVTGGAARRRNKMAVSGRAAGPYLCNM